MLVSESQPTKALFPMFVTPYGILIQMREIHRSKAKLSIVVSDSGRVKDVRPEHPEKA